MAMLNPVWMLSSVKLKLPTGHTTTIRSFWGHKVLNPYLKPPGSLEWGLSPTAFWIVPGCHIGVEPTYDLKSARWARKPYLDWVSENLSKKDSASALLWHTDRSATREWGLQPLKPHQKRLCTGYNNDSCNIVSRGGAKALQRNRFKD